MGYFSSAAFIICGLNLILGVYAYFKRRSIITRNFLFLSLSVAIWACGLGFEVISPNEDIGLFWAKFLHLGVAFIPSTYFYFISHTIKYF